MKTGIYLSLREDKSFHTIIIKKEIGEFIYFASVGYAGGRAYEEFFGKFWIDPATDNFSGLYSNSTGSGYWENKMSSLKFNVNTQRFDAETEGIDEFMEGEDEKIQWGFIEEIKKYIKYGYDEETDMDIEYPEAKPVDTSIFREFEQSPGKYHNDNWNSEWLEITNSDIWGLSVSFPHVIDNYL